MMVPTALLQLHINIIYKDTIFKNLENAKNLDNLRGASWMTNASMLALSPMGWVPPEKNTSMMLLSFEVVSENDIKKIRRLVAPRADGSYIVPKKIADMWNDKQDGGRAEVERLWLQCGGDKDSCLCQIVQDQNESACTFPNRHIFARSFLRDILHVPAGSLCPEGQEARGIHP